MMKWGTRIASLFLSFEAGIERVVQGSLLGVVSLISFLTFLTELKCI